MSGNKARKAEKLKAQIEAAWAAAGIKATAWIALENDELVVRSNLKFNAGGKPPKGDK